MKPRSYYVLPALLLASAPILAQQLQPESPLRVVYNSGSEIKGDGDKLTVDVFWCSGDAKAQNRALSASEFAGAWAAVSRLIPKVGSEVNEIRTRPIDKQVFLSDFSMLIGKDGVKKPILRFDASNEKVRYIVSEFDKGSMSYDHFSSKLNNSTPNYLSAYLCQDIDLSQHAGQLYVQIQSVQQKQATTMALAELAKEYPGISIATGIEIVGDRAPAISEIRYFANKDSLAAKSVASQLSVELGMVVTPKFVAGYEGKVRPGSLEAWISDR